MPNDTRNDPFLLKCGSPYVNASLEGFQDEGYEVREKFLLCLNDKILSISQG